MPRSARFPCTTSAVSKDLAASVRARLLNIAKAEGTDFNQILVRHYSESPGVDAGGGGDAYL